MACTTLLVGKKASYDGSTIIARNDDSQSGVFTTKKFTIINSNEIDKTYTSIISHLTIELPDNPMRISATPNVSKKEGIWAASGVNEKQVAMTATETITSNSRVLGADPLVKYDAFTNTPGGIGEEDIVYIVLPYINSAREGVLRLGGLLEKYGTYEMNGIAFSDEREIWWLETIGGHHWIAKRVPDDVYVVMPNQLGIDEFDLDDAFNAKANHLCSSDLKEFIENNHLDLNIKGSFNPRLAFGSHDDSDHIYNTPRAWDIERYLNPRSVKWSGEDSDYTTRSDDIPWCMVPEHKITIEEVKYVLSSHYQGTPYDPYGRDKQAGTYRPIGINRTDVLSIIQIRQLPKDYQAIQWVAFGSNAFNTVIPFYTDVEYIPEYLSKTSEEVSTNYFYWNARLIAALCDANIHGCSIHLERYIESVMSKAHQIISKYDALLLNSEDKLSLKHKANQEISDMLEKETNNTLDKVLFEVSNGMKNGFSRSDA